MFECLISLPVDAAYKAIRRYGEKKVDRCKQPITVAIVPDQPDPDKRVLSVRVSRELYRKLQKEARSTKQMFNEFIRGTLLLKTDHVVLTKADYAQIVRERTEYVANLKTKKKKKAAG